MNKHILQSIEKIVIAKSCDYILQRRDFYNMFDIEVCYHIKHVAIAL